MLTSEQNPRQKRNDYLFAFKIRIMMGFVDATVK